MKLDYNILWLDDARKEIIEGEYHFDLLQYIEELGFKPRIEIVKTEKDFFELIDTNEKWDLILTDYNLDEIAENAEKGDTVIKKVRERNVNTEILFYTKKDDGNRIKGFDRITFFDTSKAPGEIHNEKVVEKAQEIIDLTVSKFQDIVAMRGMIMHETSTLDVEMEKILQKIISISDEEEKVISLIKKKYIKSVNQTIKEIENFSIEDTMLILRKIGATHRWRAIVRNLEKSEIKTVLEQYPEEVISIRNKFAHAELVGSGDRKYFVDKENGLEFNQYLCKSIRENILKHKENLGYLKAELGI